MKVAGRGVGGLMLGLHVMDQFFYDELLQDNKL
jgi:hypothetical protein